MGPGGQRQAGVADARGARGSRSTRARGGRRPFLHRHLDGDGGWGGAPRAPEPTSASRVSESPQRPQAANSVHLNRDHDKSRKAKVDQVHTHMCVH